MTVAKVSKRAHVTLTTLADVSDVPDIRANVYSTRMVRPDQVSIRYDYAPADDFTDRTHSDRTITVYGRYVLKAGDLGKDRVRRVLYMRDEIPAWVSDIEEANRPDWDALRLPGI